MPPSSGGTCRRTRLSYVLWTADVDGHRRRSRGVGFGCRTTAHLSLLRLLVPRALSDAGGEPPKAKGCFRDHKDDLQKPPFRDILVYVDPGFTTVRSRDSWRIDGSVTENSDPLCVVFDGNATIHEIELS